MKNIKEYGEGSRHLSHFADIYSTRTHFIFEVLQNAEDALSRRHVDRPAGYVHFHLHPDRLEIRHNGALFTEHDVIGICGIGEGTKTGDYTQIGKFGIGFKSVYAYTFFPQIHSGNEHFEIRRFVEPHAIASVKNKDTLIVLPLDQPSKRPKWAFREDVSAHDAVREIGDSIRKLGIRTLLFLRHIDEIKWTLPDNTSGHFTRNTEPIKGNNGLRKVKVYDQDKHLEEWLVFTRDVKVQDAGQSHQVTVENAFLLNAGAVTRADNTELVVFFPTEKETKLGFLIQAPFKTTKARDNIKSDDPANYRMIEAAAQLAADSLSTLRDNGLLTVNFLAVLPIQTDELTKFYEPIRKAIIEAFRKQDLTPTRSGKHKPAGALYRGPAKIAEALGDKGLSWLTDDEGQSWLNGDEIPLWAANAPQENQREDRFLQSLEIDEWGWSELASSFDPPHPDASQNNEYSENSLHKRRIEYYISEMDDSKLMRFYALLGEAVDVHEKHIDIEDLCIIRVTTEDGDEHVTSGEAYLLPENNVAPPPDVLFVKPEVYSAGRSPSQKKFAISFLKTVGVRVYDEQAGIERLLELYKGDQEISERQHQKHIRQFITFWKEHPREIGMFRDVPFLIGSPNEDEVWFAPDQLCLDKPYLDSGLSQFTEIHEKYALADSYKDFLKGAQLEDFVNFVKAAGVMSELEVIRVNVYSSDDRNCRNHECRELHRDWDDRTRFTNTGVDDDYSIKGLVEYLNAHSIYASRLIWDALLRAEAKAKTARFSPNQKYKPRTADSQLVYRLKNSAWIPDKFGEFRLPQEMTKDDLRKDFPYDGHDRNGLLTAIGFGAHAGKLDEVYRERNQFAQSFGFGSAEELDKLQQARDAGFNPDEWLAQNAQRKQITQPEDSVPDPARREEKVLANTADAPSKESIKLERTIQKGISDVTAQAKAHLRTKYKNADSQLVCQCCHKEMPFKMRSGEYYFEAVQCIGDRETRHFQNRLALCPTCAAMYQYARETDDAELRRRIVEHEAPDNAASVEISVRLAGRQFQLRFVGTHWFDLKIVLSEPPSL